MSILILEASTASAKAMLYDAQKGIVRYAARQYNSSISRNGMQDADAVYDLLLSVGAEVTKGADVAAVVVGGVWHSLLVCDEANQPITDVLTWEYMEASPTAKRIRQDESLTAELYQRTGCMVHSIYPAYKLLHMKEEGMNLTGRHVFTHGSYQFFRLTGVRHSTACMESGGSLLNIHRLEYDECILDLIGLKSHQLPELVTYKQTQPLSGKAAARLNVPAGIPVAPPHADGALNQVGAGGLQPGIMTLSVGTSAAIRMAFDAPYIPHTPGTWCYAAPEKWLCGAATSGATNCVEWFVKVLNKNSMSFSEMEYEIKKPERAPIFLPFLFGERCPSWMDERQGGFIGLNAGCGIGEMYYAILEGILFNILQCFKLLTKESGLPRVIRVSGGICKSNFWLQMLADMIGHPISVSKIEQGSLLGGAVLGMYSLGYLNRLTDYKITGETIVNPDKSKKGHYASRFKRYMEAYGHYQ